MKHIEFEKLVKNLDGALSLIEEQEIAEHLRACDECAATNAKLKSFFDYARADRNEPVSQATTAHLLNIFKPQRNVSAKPQSLAKRVLAGLIFDDWQTALNERFVAADSRHLVYRAGQFEIDLRLHFIGGKCQLSGQVLPDCGEAATVEIFSADRSEKVFFNNYCEFVFSPVKEGVYTLRLSVDEINIEIENFSLVG